MSIQVRELDVDGQVVTSRQTQTQVVTEEGVDQVKVVQSSGVELVRIVRVYEGLSGEDGEDGQNGNPGPPGPQGPQGPPSPDSYYAEFSYASPSTLWTVVHNQGSLAVNVETVDTNGDPIEGNVRKVDENTIEIDWYYPTAGTARASR